MLNSWLKKHSREVYAISLLLIGLGIVFLLGEIKLSPPAPDIANESMEPIKLGYGLEVAEPMRLRIPSIGVDTYFVRLGLKPNREIEVPAGYEEVGWYINGPTPGEIGPAVVLGHVGFEWRRGVFYPLGKIQIGDEIEVERQDGQVAVFRVDKIEEYPQSSFPTSLVYGDIDYAGIRLITCSGSFDAASQRYDSNLIVYGSLVGVRGELLDETEDL